MQSRPQLRLPIDIRGQIKMIEDQDSGHIYALNTTDNVRPHKGSISMRATNQFGDPITVFLPNTYIPIDLAEEVGKLELLKSPDFLRMLRQGMMQLISDEDAENALADPRALQESQRLYNEKYGGAMEIPTPPNTRIAATGREQQPANEPNLPPLRSGSGVVSEDTTQDPYEDVNPVIREAMERIDLSDADRYNLVMNHSNNLNEIDINYIMNNTNDLELRQLCSDLSFHRHRGG